MKNSFIFPFSAHTHCLHFLIIYSFTPQQATFTTQTHAQRASVSSVHYPGIWALLCRSPTLCWNVPYFGFHTLCPSTSLGFHGECLCSFLHWLFFFHCRLWAFFRSQTSVFALSTSAQVSSISVVLYVNPPRTLGDLIPVSDTCVVAPPLQPPNQLHPPLRQQPPEVQQAGRRGPLPKLFAHFLLLCFSLKYFMYCPSLPFLRIKA